MQPNRSWNLAIWLSLSIGLGVVVAAQTVAPITGYEVQVFRTADATTGPPFRVQTVALTSLTCNLMPTTPPSGTLVNPTIIEFDDPAAIGRACRANVGPLFSALPVATGYRATITALSLAGPSARSNVSNPFDAAQVPPAGPAGLGVRP